MKSVLKIVIVSLALAGLGVSGTMAQMSDTATNLPPNAKPGECYARVLIPAVYKTTTEQVLKKEASERIEIVPAKFEWVEERVMTKEASTRMAEVPARYDWAEEKILVKPAQTVWKKGRGPIERVDNGTGEIMCLVEEPAVYETVRKRMLVEPAKTQTVEVPAEYQTVRVRKLVSPPQERRVEIPAEYGTVTKRSVVSEAQLVWKPVLCQTNLSPTIVSNVQRALSSAGHNPGPIDGVIGQQTLAAVTSFQRSKGLATGGLTMETLRKLNVSVN